MRARGELRRIVHDLHADAAAAAGGLDEERVADALGLARRRPASSSIAMGPSVPGGGSTPAARATARALILSPKASSTEGGGPMKVSPRRPPRSAKPRVLAEQAVAGVHRVGAVLLRRGEDGRGSTGSSPSPAAGRCATASSAIATWGALASASEWTATVANPEALAGANDAAGDLAAVGDEDLLQHGAEFNTPALRRIVRAQGVASARNKVGFGARRAVVATQTA